MDLSRERQRGEFVRQLIEQGLVNAVVAAAEAGKAISCRKGCGACCRQLVPISRTEAERLLSTVAALFTLSLVMGAMSWLNPLTG